MNCKECGAEFTPHKLKPHQKFCSEGCCNLWWKGHRAEGKKYVYTCQYCGKEYQAKSVERNQYCSRECAFASKGQQSIIRKAEEVARKEATWPYCPVCGKRCRAYHHKYCSSKCATIAINERQQRAYIPRSETKICPVCHKQFTLNMYAGNTAYCSQRCRRLARRSDRVRSDDHSESISIKYITKRDKGQCQLCGKKVLLNERHPHPLSASIDHIIPLSQGGNHSRANTQLAHLRCNVVKGVKVGNSQLRLLG
jgi:5-methylcytosine-specific restriction endonuclease McrA